MSYDFKQTQKAESIKRMQLLDLPDEIIEDFTQAKRVCKLDTYGSFYALTDEEEVFITQFEQQRNAVVYFVLESYTYNYKMLNFFYVCNYMDEWAQDQFDLEHGKAICYVQNLDIPEFSDVGKIYFRHTLWGIYRYA